MDIETKNATLATLAVTINALHVNGKQMTLAVFRQLPINVENESSEIWGTVRYRIKDEGDLWLVFSTDGLLFRRVIELRKPYPYTGDIEKLKREISNLNARTYMDKDKRESAIAKLEAELKAAVSEEEERMDYARKIYDKEVKLSSLQQLFIAV